MKKHFWFLKTQILYRFVFGRIGKRTYIGKPMLVVNRKKIFLGNNVRIFPGMRAEALNGGEIFFEGDNSIGQNLHIISYNSKLSIGYGATISSNVFISNVDHTFEINKSALATDLISKDTTIGKYCFIGTGCVILPGTILGDNVIVGANSTVKGVFASGSIIAGSPAVVKRKLKNGDNLESDI